MTWNKCHCGHWRHARLHCGLARSLTQSSLSDHAETEDRKCQCWVHLTCIVPASPPQFQLCMEWQPDLWLVASKQLQLFAWWWSRPSQMSSCMQTLKKIRFRVQVWVLDKLVWLRQNTKMYSSMHLSPSPELSTTSQFFAIWKNTKGSAKTYL